MGAIMRVVLGTICFVVAASPALAQVSTPAPLLGVGLPVTAALGAVLLLSRFFKRS